MPRPDKPVAWPAFDSSPISLDAFIMFVGIVANCDDTGHITHDRLPAAMDHGQSLLSEGLAKQLEAIGAISFDASQRTVRILLPDVFGQEVRGWISRKTN